MITKNDPEIEENKPVEQKPAGPPQKADPPAEVHVAVVSEPKKVEPKVTKVTPEAEHDDISRL